MVVSDGSRSYHPDHSAVRARRSLCVRSLSRGLGEFDPTVCLWRVFGLRRPLQSGPDGSSDRVQVRCCVDARDCAVVQRV